ncbi:MAG: hypothetical protein ABWX96_01335 [Propionibacteriaceae bacterium]
MTPERFPLLIGAILGDGDEESLRWLEALGDLTREALRLGRHDYEDIVVNIVFRVDGTVLPLDFSGVRTGSYFTASRTLEVQAAMGKDPVPDRRAPMVQLVADAVDVAETHLIRRKLTKGIPEVRAIVAALQSP